MDWVRRIVTPAWLIRAAAYCGVFLLTALQLGSFSHALLTLLSIALPSILALNALLSYWPRSAHLAVPATALADLCLAALLVWRGLPSARTLFILVLVADGIQAGWKITLALGLGASALSLLFAYVQPAQASILTQFIPDLIFWLLLTAIVTVWAFQRERDCRHRSSLEDNLQIRSDRLSMLSHEVRTPLTLMRTSLELLFDESAGPLTPQQRTFLETIFQNEERVNSLAQNLLTQAKLEAGVFSPKFQVVDLRQIIRSAVKDLSAITSQRNQRVITYYPQVLPPISADPDLIRQVLINLIQNASRFSSEGGRIIITISQNDYNMLIAVTDDGAGMGYEHRRQLFRHFSTPGNRLSDGTGLGLVIVKNIVERHGGQVYVDTLLGRGTSFYVTLPYQLTEKNYERASLDTRR
ncbi:MAG: hypothetical protein PWQ55_2069 [Chloroflexota bacterium]|nr:hypothetical protein [Chloroflexota bacterium]